VLNELAVNSLFSEARMQLHCRLRGNCERNMLHRADRVAIALGLGTSGDFEEGKQPVAPHVEEVVTDFLERRIATIARPCPDAGRHLHRMHQPHAEHTDIEVDSHFHIVEYSAQGGVRRNNAVGEPRRSRRG
jgi:hypothetical protein